MRRFLPAAELVFGAAGSSAAAVDVRRWSGFWNGRRVRDTATGVHDLVIGGLGGGDGRKQERRKENRHDTAGKRRLVRIVGN